MNIKHSTFKGGIHPPGRKELTSGKKLVIAKAPETVVIPMLMHSGAPAKPIVKKGDLVKVGQCIGEPNGFISAMVHSSVSGEVIAVEPRLHPKGQKILSVVIKSDMQDTLYEEVKPKGDLESLSPEEIKQIVQEAGIIGMGGAAFPTHVKLTPRKGKTVEHIILNGAECEPYLTSDEYIMNNHADKVVFGLKAMMKCMGVQRGYIGIEDNKKEAIEAISRALGNDESIELFSLHTKYPQGYKDQLITAIIGKEVPSGGSSADVGAVVFNVGTAAAISDAIQEGMPLIERIVTISGGAVKNPSVLKAKIGANIADLIENCGGFSEEPTKIINGGPMTGLAQYSPDIPLLKETTGISCLTKEEAEVPNPQLCIRCGKCASICPVRLLPLYIAEYSLNGDYEKCKKYHALDCMECGSCSYICPSKRTLLSSIRVAKREIIANSRKEK